MTSQHFPLPGRPATRYVLRRSGGEARGLTQFEMTPVNLNAGKNRVGNKIRTPVLAETIIFVRE